MQIQMTTDYALRILVYLAFEKRVVSSTELSRQLDIPAKYVLRVGNKLKAGGFIETVTGSKGGYMVGRPFEDISVYDVVTAFEGDIKLNRCAEIDGYCGAPAKISCNVHQFFKEMQQELQVKMKAETLATLLIKSKKQSEENL